MISQKRMVKLQMRRNALCTDLAWQRLSQGSVEVRGWRLPPLLLCRLSERPSWTAAGCRGLGKLCWPGRLVPHQITVTKASFCVFRSFPLGNAIHQNPMFCSIRQVTNLQQFLSFLQDSPLVYLRVQTCVRNRQDVLGNLLPLHALWMSHNHPELFHVYNGIFPSFLLSSVGNLCSSELTFHSINDPISLHHCSLDQKLH